MYSTTPVRLALATTCAGTSDELAQVPGAVMRPGALKRALVVVGCGVLTVTLSACQSTEDESAKIGRQAGALAAGPAALKLGAVNHSVRVSDVTLLKSSGRTAVAARLTASTSRTQLNVPVLVKVTGAGGKLLYTNETGGVEESLQRMALLRPHQGAWWVDDQVLVSQSSTGVKVAVGTGSSPRPGDRAPALATKRVRLEAQSGLSVLSGKLVNESGRALSKVPVFAVGLRAGKVVAAGRAIVSELPGRVSASVPFQIFLVGNPAGAMFELSAVPAAA
jgi:hypothetical protein